VRNKIVITFATALRGTEGCKRSERVLEKRFQKKGKKRLRVKKISFTFAPALKERKRFIETYCYRYRENHF